MANPIKRCAIINDFSGFGRCSLSVSLPIISAMGVQCCTVPTAILSNHTGYSSYFFESFTDKMQSYIKEWQKLKLDFDLISTGFLGCNEQFDIVKSFINDFKQSKTIIVVDPVMADNGKIYSTYTDEMCSKMKDLISVADVITPNITEACILSGEKYDGEEISFEKAKSLCQKLNNNKKTSVVITGIISGEDICSFVYDKYSDSFFKVCTPRVKKAYPGTGDLFTSVICASLLNQSELKEAVSLASKFIYDAASYSINFDTDINDGLIYEPFLKTLIN